MRLTSFIFRTGIAVSVFASILSCTRYEPGLEQALALAGDNRIEGFTLCFEDRDAVQGLHRFRDLQLEAGDTLQRLTVQLRISADEYAALFRLDGTSYPSLRSCFRLRIAGGTAHYTLAAIASYDPQSGIARCLFDRLTTDRP